jgi:hypothetical protein
MGFGIPESYMMLQAVSTGISMFSKVSDYEDQTARVFSQYDAANRQVAQNNTLAYNSYLHLGEIQQLEAKKHAVRVDEQYRVARKTLAAEKVLAYQQGGMGSQTGEKRFQVLEAELSMAIHRKQENFETVTRDIQRKQHNVTLDTLNKNNQAFSGLSSLPSKTGLIAGIAGDAINAGLSIGYGQRADGKIYNRFTGSTT